MEQNKQKPVSHFDFLYLDKERLSSIGAQIFDGVMSGFTRAASNSAQQGKSAELSVPAVVKGNIQSTDLNVESIEHHYDARWNSAIEALNGLHELGKLHKFNADMARLGQVVAFEGSISVIDLRVLKSVAKPMIDIEMRNFGKKTNANKSVYEAKLSELKTCVQLMEVLPFFISLRAFNSGNQLWGTLQPEAMLCNMGDLAFKHGCSVSGEWTVVAIIDALPDICQKEQPIPQALSELEMGMLQVNLQLRALCGRKDTEYGTTPLAIYRPIC